MLEQQLHDAEEGVREAWAAHAAVRTTLVSFTHHTTAPITYETSGCHRAHAAQATVLDRLAARGITDIDVDNL